ncbi:hypothetical protein BDZ97DRAFT_573252 [Flammula alnicola]|nr:hypothetical protein BDZ97DRAFT_573252 [Flammula alnicola]
MAVLNTPLFLISAFFVSSAHAQMVFRGRRSTAGRIVAGCIVAVLFALFLICVLVKLRKRHITPSTLPNTRHHRRLRTERKRITDRHTRRHRDHHLRPIQLDKITPSSVVSVPNASIPNITCNTILRYQSDIRQAVPYCGL